MKSYSHTLCIPMSPREFSPSQKICLRLSGRMIRPKFVWRSEASFLIFVDNSVLTKFMEFSDINLFRGSYLKQ